MNWIDARKQQILDEHEKRKSYEDIEERALKTQEDYQKEVDKLIDEDKKINDKRDKLFKQKQTDISKINANFDKLDSELLRQHLTLVGQVSKLQKEAKAKGFKLKA